MEIVIFLLAQNLGLAQEFRDLLALSVGEDFSLWCINGPKLFGFGNLFKAIIRIFCVKTIALDELYVKTGAKLIQKTVRGRFFTFAIGPS